MGRDKAFVEVDGTPLVGVVAAALEGAGASRWFAVGGDERRLAARGVERVADRDPGAGPLGGLVSALAAAGTDVVVVLACDLPGARTAAVEAVLDALLAAPGAAVAWPEAGGRAQVLHAAWRVGAALPVLAAAFAAGERSVRRAADGLPRVVVRTVDPSALRDADRPADLGSGPPTGQNGAMSDASPMSEVDVATLADVTATGAFVLDVRQPDEYEAGHVPGAVLVPLDQLGARIDEVPKDRHLYVVCRSGGRSATAVGALTAAGYEATNVAGGTLAWIEAGNPVVTGPDAGAR
jgi:rhodanese-related sulfurtransferase/molybdopterin-guanine dinucleotide biosynthesis protein A